MERHPLATAANIREPYEGMISFLGDTNNSGPMSTHLVYTSFPGLQSEAVKRHRGAVLHIRDQCVKASFWEILILRTTTKGERENDIHHSLSPEDVPAGS